MKKIFLIIANVFLSLSASDSRQREVGDPSLGLNIALGAGSYNLDVIGMTYQRAIAYDIAELTLGVSKSHDKWKYGIYYKKAIDEISSSQTVARTGEKDKANIDRSELLLYATYVFDIRSFVNYVANTSTNIGDEVLSLNMVYYNSSLDAYNKFNLGSSFQNDYKYDSQGIKASVHYNFKPNHKNFTFSLGGGLVYAMSSINFNEYKDGQSRHFYVNDEVDQLSYNVGMVATYDLTTNVKISFIADYYKLDFGEVDVMSQTQGFIEKANFTERTTSARLGVIYMF